MHSAGQPFGDSATIQIGDVVLIGNGAVHPGRGVNVVAMSGRQPLITSSFDTFSKRSAADAFADAIDTLPVGCLVILAVRDEATIRVNQRAQSAIHSIGGTIGLLNQPYRCSYYCIGVKGMDHGKAIEELS